MIKWSSIPFFRFALAFMAGIFFYICSSPKINCFYLFAFSALLYTLLSFISLNEKIFYTLKPYIGFAGLLMLFFFGAFLPHFKEDINNYRHIINLNKKIEFYQATVTENSEEKTNSFKTEISIDKVKTNKGWEYAEGKTLLYNKKNNFAGFKYGDQILIKGSPELVKEPFNPFEFNYKEYLAFKNIYHSQFLNSNEAILIGHKSPYRLLEISIALRSKADSILRKFIHGNNEYKIASALILGIRSSLDNDLKNAYSSTGTMHVLAVSGLHVGLVFGILMILLQFLRGFSFGPILIPVILILSLWIYAFITGFSVSVLRAALMFTMVVIADSLKRNSNIYNTIGFSAFALLCFDPFFIMDTGFQLSYLAVLGIVYFNPKIYSLFTFKNIIADKIWLLTSVSISAQIATFPISLYYFHQFPLNFIISNLAAIPISFITLYSGIALIFFFWIPGVNNILGWITEKTVWTMNQIIFQIEDIPYSVIKNINLDLFEIIGIYLLIILVICFLFYKKINYLILSTLVFLVFTIHQIIEIREQKNQNKFIAFNIKGHTAWGFVKGREINILADSLLILNNQKQTFHIYPYLIKNGINEIHFQDINDPKAKGINIFNQKNFSLICYKGKSFLIQKNKFTKEKVPFTCDHIIDINNNNKAFELSL